MSVDDPRTRKKESQRLSVREELLSSILDEAASAASMEEKYWDRERRLRSAQDQKQKVTAEEARRDAVAQQLAQEEARRREAEQLRASLTQEIHLEHLRQTGMFSPDPSPETAPDTGEYTHEEILQAAAHVRAAQQTGPVPSRTTPALIAAGLVVLLGLGGLVAALVLSGGPELDPTVYSKTRVSTVDTRPATTVLAMNMIPQPEPEVAPTAIAADDDGDHSSRRRSRRNRRNRASAEEPATETSATARSTVTENISLDGGDSVWERRDY